MNPFKSNEVGWGGFRGEVQYLPSNDAGSPTRPCEFEHRGLGGGAHREPFKGESEEGVAGEKGIGFSKTDMAGGESAAEIVIIHAGKIVMDKSVGMEELEREGREESGIRVSAANAAGLKREQGPQPLATSHHRIAHGFMEDSRRSICGREIFIESLFDKGLILAEPFGKGDFSGHGTFCVGCLPVARAFDGGNNSLLQKSREPCCASWTMYVGIAGARRSQGNPAELGLGIFSTG